MNNITFETETSLLAAVPIGTQVFYKTHHAKEAIFWGSVERTKNGMICIENNILHGEISAFAVPNFGAAKDPFAGRYMPQDSPFEVIKVIDACKVGFNVGNAMKYIARADKKGDRKTDLKKCLDYLNFALKYKIPHDFVHQKDNPYTWQEVAEAWELDAKLTQVLELIWNGNIEPAIVCLSTS